MATATSSERTKLRDRLKRFRKSKPKLSLLPSPLAPPDTQTHDPHALPFESATPSLHAPGPSNPDPILTGFLTSSLLADLLPFTWSPDLPLIPLIPSTLHPLLAPHFLGPPCLPSTRVALRRQIANWASDPRGTAMFWLTGRSGEGKSTLARTVTRALEDGDVEGARLGACWFFGDGQEHQGPNRPHRMSGPVMFVRAVAAQLAERVYGFADAVARAVEADPEMRERDFEEQFEHLILGPLKEVGTKVPEVGKASVLVVDAIDKCEEREARMILRVLASTSDVETVPLRVIVTSTPEVLDCFGLLKPSSPQRQHLTCAKMATKATGQDLAVYLSHELSDIRTKRSSTDSSHLISPDWPGNESVSTLVKISTPSFHIAATLCRFIADSGRHPWESLRVLTECQFSTQMASIENKHSFVLGQLLSESMKNEAEELKKELQEVIGLITVLADPLSPISLSKLLNLPTGVITDNLNCFRFLFDVPADSSTPLRLHHPSSRSHILDIQSHEGSFWVDQAGIHRKLSTLCLKLLSENLISLGTPRSALGSVQNLPEHVQYACRYWIHHLKVGGSQVLDGDDFDCFVRKHLLHWIEVLALLGEVQEVIPMLMMLQSILEADEAPSLRTLIQDAVRFMLSFQSVIHDTPLQLYSSALVFSPEGSPMKEVYKMQALKLICRTPIVRETWSSALQTLVGHEGCVYSVRFSPDGKKLISASGDKTVRVWDSLGGGLRETLKCHREAVNFATFSSTNPQLMASVSDDRVVHVYNETEITATRTLEGHSGSIESVAFSPDGTQIASTSFEMRIHDAETGVLLKAPKGDKEEGSLRLAYSPDGRKIVSVSWYGGMIRIWDTTLGRILHAIKRYKSKGTGALGEQFGAVAFSPDGKHFATGTLTALQLWDVDAGTEVREFVQYNPLGGHALAFSPGGKLLAASTNGPIIKVWDIEGAVVVRNINCALDSAFHGMDSYAKGISISSDGKKLAAVSDGNAVLFDMETGSRLKILTSSDASYDIAFSPDSSQLAWTEYERGIVLADAATGESTKIFSIRRGVALSVAFSPDGKRLVGGAQTGGLQVWDIDSEAVLLEPDGHKSAVHSADFSLDSTRLATASSDDTVRLWDLLTGRMIREWYIPTGNIGRPSTDSTYKHYIVFSLNNDELVSGSSDKSLRWWDTGTGELVHSSQEHSAEIRAIARCPNGEKLASASDDMTIKLWDWKGKKAIRTLQGHKNKVSSVIFSPDGKHLASGSKDGSMGLWDVATGTLLRKVLLSTQVNDLAFSPDGCQLALALWDGTIQLHDAHTLLVSSTPQRPPARITSLTFSPSSSLLAAIQSDHTVRLVDPTTNTQLGLLTGHSGAVNSAAFSVCSIFLATTSDDCTVKLWSTLCSPPALLHTLTGHSGWVRCAVFAPGARMLASGADDRTIRLWSLPGGALLQTLRDAHADWIRALAFSPDGSLLASASDDQTVRVWDVSVVTGKAPVLVHALEEHTGWVTAVAFSGYKNIKAVEAARVTAAEGEKDESGGEEEEEDEGRKEMEGHRQREGRLRLASAAGDGMVRLWDARSGEQLGVYTGVGKGVGWIKFSRDQRRVETDRGPVELEGREDDGIGLNRRLIYVKRDWVEREGERLLWIPEEYKAVCSAFSEDGVLALGHRDGLITFYEFD